MNKELETKRRGLFFTSLMTTASFLAMVKVLFLRFLFRKSLTEIREKYYASFFIDRFCSIASRIRKNATSWRALDEIYNYDEKIKSLGRVELRLTEYWMNLNNARALRNRARLLSKFLIKDLQKRLTENGNITFLSIASGSAQPVYEALSSFKPTEQKRIKLFLLDLDPSAIEFSRVLQKKYNIVSKIERFNNSTSELETLFKHDSFDIIEMAGFLDYRTDEQSVRLVSTLKDLLKDNGLFATCNIYPNLEKFYFDWALLWPMIYRNERRFEKILVKAGFEHKNIKTIIEPLKVHVLSFCKK